ncbi:MAG: hypothetical protein ABIQ59_12255, partial [Nocardioidaceae bacterium]
HAQDLELSIIGRIEVYAGSCEEAPPWGPATLLSTEGVQRFDGGPDLLGPSAISRVHLNAVKVGPEHQ